jgi:hypothetical protein
MTFKNYQQTSENICLYLMWNIVFYQIIFIILDLLILKKDNLFISKQEDASTMY